jgi:hypothetical protein
MEAAVNTGKPGPGKARGMRSILILAVAFTAFTGAAYGASGSGASRVRSSVDFAIVIPAVVRAKALTEPRSLPIEDSDVQRGYIDVDDESSLMLTSNAASGYAVSVAFDPRLVARVAVRIQGNTLEAESQGSWLHVDAPRMIDAPLRVGYRIFLTSGARAGTYRWPVALAFGTGA